jgi:hypothetical protein
MRPRTVLLAAGAAGLALALAQPAAAESCPWVGHAERTVTTANGTFSLELFSGATTLPAAGGTVPVVGAGYDTKQGIFLAFCEIPKSVVVDDPSTYTALPTPCLGGRESTDGSARRITDSATGTPGVTIPYRPDGSFRTTLNIKPEINTTDVCDVNVECAIVTRADFTATTNRSYDQYIPVHFAK